MSKPMILELVAVFLITIGLVRFFWPTPAVSATPANINPLAQPPTGLPWPGYGQGALAAQGYGMLQESGEQKAVPMASITKVVTALAVLKQKPLAAGQTGPNITINSNDVAIYNNYYSQGGSVVKVVDGEQISEYQALQGLLIPSANNLADTLVIRAFGSMDNYVAYANKMVADLGLGSTKVADASGFSPASVSSAQDLAKLGLAALDNPLLASIVVQQTADLPSAGTVNNTNWLLGEDGVIGIKTGNTDQAGGCFLFAAKRVVGGKNITLVGALMQAPDLNTAVADARTLTKASDSGFSNVTIAKKGQVVGTYKTPWKASADVVTQKDLNVLAWSGTKLQPIVRLNRLKPPAKAGATVGSVSITSGPQTMTVPVVLKNDLSGPSWTWRLFR